MCRLMSLSWSGYSALNRYDMGKYCWGFDRIGTLVDRLLRWRIDKHNWQCRRRCVDCFWLCCVDGKVSKQLLHNLSLLPTFFSLSSYSLSLSKTQLVGCSLNNMTCCRLLKCVWLVLSILRKGILNNDNAIKKYALSLLAWRAPQPKQGCKLYLLLLTMDFWIHSKEARTVWMEGWWVELFGILLP